MNTMILRLRGLKGELNTQFGITKIALFGSYATGNETEESDIDILILEMDRKNGFTIARAKRFLSDYLHRDVDLGLYDSLRPFIKSRIKDEIIYV